MIQAIHDTEPLAVIEFAGAGVQALAWLHGIAGSSRTILEATDRYASQSLIEAIGYEPRRFTTPGVAQALALTAYRRAEQLTDSGVPVIGLGCTATIATDRRKRGDHRCCIATFDNERLVTTSLILSKGSRTRQAEERVVSGLMINALAEASGVEGFSLDLLAGDRLKRQAFSVDDVRSLLRSETNWVSLTAEDRISSGQTCPKVALLSGSFNPLHDGHRRMAEVAGRLLGREVYYELPLVNAGKGGIDPLEALRRRSQFTDFATLMLTRTPLFGQKARVFPDSTFVIGIDTATRLFQPKFYDDDPTKMWASFDLIKARDCRFLVAGRVRPDDHFATLADI
ncbi:MAG: hypothetical protein R3264_02985, partial [Anaerolineae bacterium]|nr:hypothetical protein [Anaerolineae bacterium]